MKLILTIVVTALPCLVWATSNNPFALKEVKRAQSQITDEKTFQNEKRLEPTLGVAATTSESQNIVYKYDELGRLVCVIDPFAGNRKFDYDNAGNRKSVTEVACN